MSTSAPWLFKNWMNGSWRSEAKRCPICLWLFNLRAEQEDRVFCMACESKRPAMVEVHVPPPRPAPPPPPPVRIGAKKRLEDDLREAVENTARMQQSEGEAK